MAKSKGIVKKQKRTKDPNAPKRALSAFFWFCHDERPKVRSANPKFTVGDVAKELGKKWGTTSSSAKAKYEAMAAKDKARYAKESAAYKNKSGGKGAAAAHDDDDDDDDDDDE